MNRGWISLYRKLSDNKLWTSEPFTRGQAWVDLLLLANHKDNFIRVRGNRLDVKRGQVGWSQLSLSERWKWSRGKIRRFLNELETVQQIVQQKNTLSTLITIVNYEQYQSAVQQTVPQTDSRRTADGQQTDTNNNDNNGNNEKKEEKDKFDFSLLWNKYPNKAGKKEAERHFNASVKTEEDFTAIQKALKNYIEHKNLPQNSYKKWQNGSTWFNNWRDYENWEEPEFTGDPQGQEWF